LQYCPEKIAARFGSRFMGRRLKFEVDFMGALRDEKKTTRQKD
jgi:hypothetical protein